MLSDTAVLVHCVCCDDRSSNGYFATWFATFCAFSFLYQEFVGGSMPLGSSLKRGFSFAPMLDDTREPNGGTGAYPEVGSSSSTPPPETRLGVV